MDTKPASAGAAGNGAVEHRDPWVLTYHIINAKPSRYIYSADCRQFESHLAWIKELRSENVAPPVITFDDGALSDFELAMPLLNKHGRRAKFFIAAGIVGNRADFMSWDQVRELAATGHAIQSHGWSHLLLTRASENQLISELERSKKEIEDRLGLGVDELSLPGGRWNEAVLKACAKTGYARVYHSDPWQPPGSRNGVEFIGRLMVRNTMTVDRLQGLVSGSRTELARYRLQHVLKEGGRKLIGDRTYHWLWQCVAKITRRNPSASRQI